MQSSFKASFGGDLMTTTDTHFRPVDCLLGPDGCVYVADFYDRRAAHLDPVDNWSKADGRIYRIDYKSAPKQEPFDLRKKTATELLALLKHPNKWWRNEARRLLAERGDKSVHPTLRKWAKAGDGQLALEALWALYQTGGTDEAFLVELLEAPGEYVRAWAVRLLGEGGSVTRDSGGKLANLVDAENSHVVLAQLACAAPRLTTRGIASLILEKMRYSSKCAEDPHMPLLVWWGIEALITRDGRPDHIPVCKPGDEHPIERFVAEQWARRLTGSDNNALLHVLSLTVDTDLTPVIEGIAKSLEAGNPASFTPLVMQRLRDMRAADPSDQRLLEILVRVKDADATAALREQITNPRLPESQQLKAVRVLSQMRDAKTKDIALKLLPNAKTDASRVALLAALGAFDDPAIGAAVLARYSAFSPAVKKKAVQLLLARPAWALLLLKQLDSGTFPKADVTVENAPHRHQLRR